MIDFAIANRLSVFASMGAITAREMGIELAKLNENLAETRSTLARCAGCGATENVGSQCSWCRQVVIDNERRG